MCQYAGKTSLLSARIRRAGEAKQSGKKQVRPHRAPRALGCLSLRSPRAVWPRSHTNAMPHLSPAFPTALLSRSSTVLESWVWCGASWVFGEGRPGHAHNLLGPSERRVCTKGRGRRRVVFIINRLKKIHHHGSSRPALPSVLLGLPPERGWQREKGGSLRVTDPRQIHLEAPSKAVAPPSSPGLLPCKQGPFRSQTHRDAHGQVVTRAVGSRGAPGSREEAPQNTVLQEWICGWRFGGKWT